MSLAGVLAILVLSVTYLVTHTLSQPLLRSPMTLTVDMPSTGGLFEGSAVTYRGMKIGRVTHVALDDRGQVAAKVTITTQVMIPASTTVRVRSLSPVGEQYLDFQPASNAGPYLKGGSTIQAAATDLPKTLASTVVAVNHLLDQIDARNLHTALHGVSTALNGTAPAIARIADQGYQLVEVLDQNWPTVDHLAQNGSTLLTLGANNAGKIDSTATSVNQIGQFLHVFQPTLRDLILNGPHRMHEVSTVVTYLGQVLPAFLDRFNAVTGIVFARLPAFGALLQNYSKGIGMLATAFSDGALRGHLEIASSYVCDYGGPKHDPTDITTHPLYTDGHCNSPAPGKLVRGAQNRPGPAD